DALDAALSAAYSPLPRLELRAILPMALYRTGSGLSGVTSQGGSDVARTTLRDVRIGAEHDLVSSAGGRRGPSFSSAVSLDPAIPTGASGSFAGEGGPILAPTVVFYFAYGRFAAGASDGARLEASRDFGGVVVGSRFVSNLGVAVEMVRDGLL